ncbi:MtnX-like HAD-IB family phosphatase [Stenotrophomonas sp. 24(2023)]|uniref:MtnX-like HAD-IB family phosphatase n=1 Tax=Stenotrophomonas sp. 24(2023) TaxID=3068324 RepID=UPI0027DF3CB7|nr:MtnX-like HAD-IB family phosphatase [Stenotrophomonas sp. 24(2023)]WMJ68409.1 MtnX-like HAD-IB family phosphatase [Stenotrophomonas sp. 24(2023)]
MRWSILVDFDGTISLEDVIDSLLDKYGQPGWEALEDQWRAGQIGSRECMQGQVRLLKLDPAELDAHLDQVKIDPDFAAFAAEAHRLGLPLKIVSDGLDYAIHRILANHGLPPLPVVANHLRWADGHWELESPYQAENCRSGTCKCTIASQSRAYDAPRVLMIGDGASDFCVSERADYVFAKRRLIDHCNNAGIPHSPITTFAQATALLPRLLDGSLVPSALPRILAVA